MEIQFYCPHWGSENFPFKDFLVKVKAAGFSGVEMSLPINAENEKKVIVNQIKNAGLLLIAQHWETIEPDFNIHKMQYAARLRNLAEANPQFINNQTGKDYFNFEQNEALIYLAAEIARETGVKIVHETHRGKFSFAAHITKDYLLKIPNLKLTLDLSHWCNVAETLLQDQPEAMLLAISRTEHIHSRVGFSQAPQVNDPRAPEWEEALNIHLHFWDQVIANHLKRKSEVFTITTEFGPAPYLPLMPYTKQPIADQWEINIFMKDLLTKRYSNLI